MRLIASLAAALGSCGGALAAEDWKTWASCDDNAANKDLERPPPSFPALPALLSYESRFQIMTINAETGLIEVGRGDFWADIETVTEPIKLIMTFGESRKGKSVVASMLGCNMSADNAMQFPTFRSDADSTRVETQGIWASKPFSIPGDDSAKYMILDMASLNNQKVYQQQEGGSTLSSLRKEDELLKMLALMSEVVSTFVYTIVGEASTSEWNTLGTAIGETRRNMVLNSREDDNGGPQQDKEVDLKSHNKPALIFVRRQDVGGIKKALKADAFEVDTAALHTQAKEQMDSLIGDVANGGGTWTLLERGFKMITNGLQGEIPFVYSTLPDIDEQTDDNSDFRWGTRAYGHTVGEACDKFERMHSDRWKCQVSDPNKVPDPDARPSAPSTYGLLTEYLTNLIVGEAPVRRVSWKGQQYPTDLTGARMKEVLETGVAEMNTIGPLPRTELWRKIMEDRCKSEVVEYLDFTFGDRSGSYKNEEKTGILKQIQDGLKRLSDGAVPTVVEMKASWAGLQKLWEQKTEFEDHIAGFFVQHVLLQAVQQECTGESTEHQTLLEEKFDSQVFEWTSILANKERQIAQERLREALKTDWWEDFWNEYKLYIMCAAFVGLILLVILMRIWRGINSTCRVCASCCGDWGDTTTTTKIITTHDGKTTAHTTRMEHGPAVPFASAMAVSAGGVTSGSSSGDPAERLEKLGKTIKELQKRASVDQ